MNSKEFLDFIQETLFTIDKIDISISVIIKIFIPFLISLLIGKIFIKLLRKKIPKIWELFGKSWYIAEIIFRLFFIISAISIGFRIAGIDRSIFYYFFSLLFKPFFNIGSSPISLISILILIFIFSLSIFLSKYSIKVLESDVYPKTSLEIGLQHIINTFLKYSIIAVGVIIGLQVNGINLSVFATIGAGLMVGVGFGLQNLASNFISGIVILLERPINVGDFVDIGGNQGVIEEINARCTLIRTRDNIEIIVPNSKFISEDVINWNHNDAKLRVKIPIGISYLSDPEFAKKLLIEIAENHESVLKEPFPVVLLDNFAASSIDMILEVWITDVHSRFQVKSDINFQIFKRFNESGIIIPFPQLEVKLLKT